MLVTSAGADARKGSCCDVNPLTVRERVFAELMSRERAGRVGWARWKETTPDGRTGRGRGGNVTGTTLARMSDPLFELCQPRYIFRFAPRVQSDCSTLAGAARVRASLGCTYAHYSILFSRFFRYTRALAMVSSRKDDADSSDTMLCGVPVSFQRIKSISKDVNRGVQYIYATFAYI